MLFAEQHGKLGHNYSLAHDRAEDLLTSTVFQLLRYIPLKDGLLPLLHRARPATLHWLIQTCDDIEIELWPRLGIACCPDILLMLKENHQTKQVILIEAKLFSGKSGRASDDTDLRDEIIVANDDALDPDQLARYWHGLRNHFDAKIDCALIYLTGHLTTPERELEESIRRAPTIKLAWMSWYDVWEMANSSASLLPAKDLEAILSCRGFATFHGFKAISPPELSKRAGFFNWFAGTSFLMPQVNHFWRDQ